MLMTSKPWLRYQRDSARVEKRGPWITMTVPVGWTVIPAARALVEGVGPAPGPVDELVGDDEVARRHLRLERPGGAGPDEAGDAHLPHGPQVGPVIDAVGRQLVAAAVAGQEGHPPAPDV